MRLIVIGAVAGGTSAAAKVRREDPSAEIVMYEMDQYISYSACGMPYYIGGEIEDKGQLTPRGVDHFKEKYNVDVKIRHEVLSFDANEKTLEVKNLETGDVFTDHYDKLLISTGATSMIPPIKGVDQDHVFSLRNINDMNKIKAFLDQHSPENAVVVGTGFIGLEMAENLTTLGLKVTVVEMLPQVSPTLDEDMATLVEEHLKDHGVIVYTNNSASEITKDHVILKDGTVLETTMVIIATGIRPNTKLAEAAGVEIGVTRAIKVNKLMETNLRDVYSVGDCAEQFNLITGKPAYVPLGSTANKTGRIAGINMTGGHEEFRGILGTAIYRVFDLAVAQTGLSEREAKKEGYTISVKQNRFNDKPGYMGGKKMTIRSVVDKKSGRVLGAQIIGEQGVDKRIDVFATLITYGATIDDLIHLDLAYSPPFSTTKDPVLYVGSIQENVVDK